MPRVTDQSLGVRKQLLLVRSASLSEDDEVAALLLALHLLDAKKRKRKVHEFLGQVPAA